MSPTGSINGYASDNSVIFAKGASPDDPSCLFNATLKGDTWRAIDFL
jgi:hypothetical protein